MSVVDLTEHIPVIVAGAAALGCTGGVCARELVTWWRKRPRVVARRARRAARRG